MRDNSKLKLNYLTMEQNLEVTATATLENGDFYSPYTYIIVGKVSSSEWFQPAQALIESIYSSIQYNNQEIVPGLSFRYGFWLVQLVAGERNRLELWELDENNQFVPGIDRALQIWDFQHKLCNTQQLKYQSANLQEQAVVNRKIFEPDQTVLGLRNEMKDMSGWVLVSNKEDLRDPSNSENMYLYEVFLQRPQLVHFLGLPTGSIFRLNDKGYNVTKPRVNS